MPGQPFGLNPLLLPPPLDARSEEAAGAVDEWAFDAAPSFPEEATPSSSDSISTSMPFSTASGLVQSELAAGHSGEAAQGSWLVEDALPMQAQPTPNFAPGSADVFAELAAAEAAAEQQRPGSDFDMGSSVGLEAVAPAATPAAALPVPPLPATLVVPQGARGGWQAGIPLMGPHAPGFSGSQPSTPPPAQQQAASSPPVLLPFGIPVPAQRSFAPAPHHHQVYTADPASHPTGSAFGDGFAAGLAAAAAAAAAAAQQHHMQQQQQQHHMQQHQQFRQYSMGGEEQEHLAQYSIGGQHHPLQPPQLQPQYSMRGQPPPWEPEHFGGYCAPPTPVQHHLDGPFQPPLHALPPHLQHPPHLQQPLPTPAVAQPEGENLDDLLGLMGIA